MDDYHKTRKHTHIIPVDWSFGTDYLAAWVEICNFGRRVTFSGGESWATISCDGEECWRIEDETTTVEEIPRV